MTVEDNIKKGKKIFDDIYMENLDVENDKWMKYIYDIIVNAKKALETLEKLEKENDK